MTNVSFLGKMKEEQFYNLNAKTAKIFVKITKE